MTLAPFHAAYRVRFDEAGPSGTLRTSGLLRYAQDVAWQHSEALGFDRGWYRERGLTWLVRGAEIGIQTPAPMGIELDVSTGVLGYRKVWARRRSEVRLPDGTLSAWIHTDWLLIDAIGRPARVPPEISHMLTAQLFTMPMSRVDLAPPPADAARRTFGVRPHELDPLRHVNNAIYVDWLEEAILAAVSVTGARDTDRDGPDSIRHFRLEYAAAAEPDDTLESVTWLDDDGWAHLVRRGAIELFRARAGDPAGAQQQR
jgi:acyl-CoA thioesterase FadM